MKKNHKKDNKTRKIILRKSERLFAKQGFERTTVRQIAKISGINTATIFYYFKTKETLHQEILEVGFNKMEVALAQTIKTQKDPAKKINDIICTFISLLQQHNNLHQIVLREMVNRSKHVEKIIKKYISKHHNMMVEIIKEGMQKGIFKKSDPSLCTFSLMGMILVYFNYDPIVKKLGKNKNDMPKHLVEHIFNMFMDGMRK